MITNSYLGNNTQGSCKRYQSVTLIYLSDIPSKWNDKVPAGVELPYAKTVSVGRIAVKMSQ